MNLTTARLRPLIPGFVLVMAAGTGALAEDTVTTCGQTLDHSATLANNLDCTGMTTAVTIRNGATLTLGGFSITGARILCDASCVIQGPGTIEDVDGGSIAARSITADGRLSASNALTLVSSNVDGSVVGYESASVEDSTIDGNGIDTIGIQTQRLSLISSTITGQLHAGVYCHFGKILGSTISDNPGSGVACAKLRIENSELTGNGFGTGSSGIFSRMAIEGYSLVKIAGTQITGNRSGVSAGHTTIDLAHATGRVLMTDSVVDGNELYGVSSIRTRISNSTVTNNGCVGAWGWFKLRFDTTDVSGNGTNVDCDRRADVFSTSTPALKDGASCGTSLGSGTNRDQSWGVCSLD